MKDLLYNYQCSDWALWLSEAEEILRSRGYKKYYQKLKLEDFAYWKTFRVGNKKVYQLGFFFYDWRKYGGDHNTPMRIGVQAHVQFINIEGNLEMSVQTDSMSLDYVEKMAETFYTRMKDFVPRRDTEES